MSAGCAPPTANARLAPRQLPDVAPGPARPEVRPPSVPSDKGATPAVPAKPAVEVAEFSAVPAATVLEVVVFKFLEDLLARKDRAALEAVEPGSTLEERLKYCLCRIQLGSAAKMVGELERQARDHPDNPAVWRLLGIAYHQVKQTAKEIDAYRRCYKLDSPKHAVCPNVTRVLGDTVLAKASYASEALAFLREELAAGPEFEWAARRLADLLGRQERHAEALFCVEAGLARNPSSGLLRYTKGVLLFDLYRLDAAKAVLEPLLANKVLGKYAKEYMFRVCLLKGEIAQARKLCEELLAMDGLDEQHKKLYTAMSDQVTRGDLGVVDCYAVLRGHKRIKVRVDVLGKLARNDAPSVATRALRIAANSQEAFMRVEALRLLVRRSSQPVADLKVGFADLDAKVRAMAATVAGAMSKTHPRRVSELVPMVLETLAAEKDSYAFRALHQALCELTGITVALPFGAAKDPEERSRLVKSWRERT